MDYLTYKKRLDYLLELISKGGVRSPKCIARRFDCTEKTIRNMINCLRDSGYNIKYCRSQGKYIIDIL